MAMSQNDFISTISQLSQSSRYSKQLGNKVLGGGLPSKDIDALDQARQLLLVKAAGGRLDLSDRSIEVKRLFDRERGRATVRRALNRAATNNIIRSLPSGFLGETTTKSERDKTSYKEVSGVVSDASTQKKKSGRFSIDPTLLNESSLVERWNLLNTKQQRGTITGREKVEKILLGGVIRPIASGIYSTIAIPKTIKAIINNPSIIKDIPSSISKSGKQFGELLRTSPTEALVKVGSEYVLFKASGKVLDDISSSLSSGLTKLSPKYVGKAKVGSNLIIKTGKSKKVNLKVVGKIPKEDLLSQISRAGKKVTATSSQADELLKLMSSRKVIRKPLGVVTKGANKGKAVEDVLSKTAKSLLKKFDDGELITSKQLKYLDDAIKSKGSKGLLERSFFADPTGKIRPSRLGIQKDSKLSLMDYLTEDISFTRKKPQILLFEDVKVQSFPKNLRNVAKKVKSGKQLTASETQKLLEFQLKKSGKFKPLGFVSKESEITLSPGEILVKDKKVGVTLVNGKKVPIIKTKVLKPSGNLKKLLNKYSGGKLNLNEIKKLQKTLNKKTGLKYDLISSGKSAGKYLNLKKVGAGLSFKVMSKTTKPKGKGIKSRLRYDVSTKRSKTSKVISRPSAPSKKRRFKSSKSIRPSSRRISGRKVIKSRKSKIRTYPKRSRRYPYKSKSRPYPVSRRKASKAISPYSPIRRSKKSSGAYPISKSRISKGGKVEKVISVSSKRKKRSKKKPKQAFHVYEKQAGKFKKVTKLPLSIKDAKDRLAFRLDTKISRTAKLVKVSKPKKVGSIGRKEAGYFRKTRKSLRNYRIVNGKRIKMPLTYIEKKGKSVISSPGEKRQLLLNRLAKARRAKKSKRKR